MSVGELYLSMRVESREGGVQHAAPHIGVAVVQGIRNKEEEEWGDLRFIQVLGQLVQSQGDATPDGTLRMGKKRAQRTSTNTKQGQVQIL